MSTDTLGPMTPKQKYDERKRLRLENGLRVEQQRKARLDRADETEEMMMRFVVAVERVADVMELWADKQGERT